MFLSFFVFILRGTCVAFRLKKQPQRTPRSSARTKEDIESEKCYRQSVSRRH